MCMCVYIYIYIYIYIYTCVCVCVCFRFLSDTTTNTTVQISHNQVGHWYIQRVRGEGFVRRGLSPFTLFVTQCLT